MQLKQLMAEVPEHLRARRRREVVPRFLAGSEVKLESDHAATRRLEDDDYGAAVGLVAGVDAIPIRVSRPLCRASETWPTRAEQSGANEIQVFHPDNRYTTLGRLTGDDLRGLRPRLVEPNISRICGLP